VKVDGRIGRTYCLHLQCRRVTQIIHADFLLGLSTLKMKSICSSETSVELHRTTKFLPPLSLGSGVISTCTYTHFDLEGGGCAYLRNVFNTNSMNTVQRPKIIVSTMNHHESQKSMPPAFTLVSFSAHSTLKKEAICSSETSVEFECTTRNYIPEYSALQVFYYYFHNNNHHHHHYSYYATGWTTGIRFLESANDSYSSPQHPLPLC
jgi:hypothetical protein